MKFIKLHDKIKQVWFRLGNSEYLNILVAILYTAAALVFFFLHDTEIL